MTRCGHESRVRAEPFLGDPYQLKQVAEFMTWRSGHSVKSDHLLAQHE